MAGGAVSADPLIAVGAGMAKQQQEQVSDLKKKASKKSRRRRGVGCRDEEVVDPELSRLNTDFDPEGKTMDRRGEVTSPRLSHPIPSVAGGASGSKGSKKKNRKKQTENSEICVVVNEAMTPSLSGDPTL